MPLYIIIFDYNNHMNKKLIVCDIDDTILPPGKDRISERLKKDFDSALAKGNKILINSGRHYRFLPPSFFEDLPMEYIACINGGCLTDRNGNVLERHPMSEEQMNLITEICEKNDIGLGFKFEDTVVTYANYQKFIEGYCGNNRRLRSLVFNDDEKRTHHLKAGLPLGTFLIGDEHIISSFAGRIPELVFAWSYHDGYDVFLKTVNKATTIPAVLKAYGMTWDDVIAFGDAGNDRPMLEKAGIGVAMGNAKDDVKSAADLVADTCVNDGVAKVLEEMKLA